MHRDFHYYLIYAIAVKAGISPSNAKILAYASQFVDDNNEHQFIRLDPGRRSSRGTRLYGRTRDVVVTFPPVVYVEDESFRTIMTQSFSINSFDPLAQRYVYLPFHFLPGVRPVTLGGRANRYATVANSGIAKRVLEEALANRNLYRIGIALHTYADTWSHQNFSAFGESWNSLGRILRPNIGHADASHDPDKIDNEWRDRRLPTQDVDNRQRAMDAIQAIYQALAKFAGTAQSWSNVEATFHSLVYDIKTPETREREINEKFGSGSLLYEKDEWTRDLIRRDRHGRYIITKSKAEFRQTHWYRFQGAAKKHFASAFAALNSIWSANQRIG